MFILMPTHPIVPYSNKEESSDCSLCWSHWKFVTIYFFYVNFNYFDLLEEEVMIGLNGLGDKIENLLVKANERCITFAARFQSYSMFFFENFINCTH